MTLVMVMIQDDEYSLKKIYKVHNEYSLIFMDVHDEYSLIFFYNVHDEYSLIFLWMFILNIH